MSLRKERYEKYELQRFSKLGEDKEPCLECSIQGRPQEHRWQAYYEKLILGLRRYVDDRSQVSSGHYPVSSHFGGRMNQTFFSKPSNENETNN